MYNAKPDSICSNKRMYSWCTAQMKQYFHNSLFLVRQTVDGGSFLQVLFLQEKRQL